jgi:hypothetical protein
MVPTALTSVILLLTTRQINALLRAKFAEELPAFQESQSHDANAETMTPRDRAAMFRCQQISPFLQSGG